MSARKVPGSVGWPLIGDKSWEFYKDPVEFARKRMTEHQSRIFMARFLNKPTVFVGSNNGVSQVLTECTESMDMGYKYFMEGIYGDNVLFTNGDEAMAVRETLSQLFTTQAFQSYQTVIEKVVTNELNVIDTSQPVHIYTFFKQLCTRVCLSLFLGLNFSDAHEAADQIVRLTTTHWHGIVSVPMNFELPIINSTTYGKALAAKMQLLKIIQERKNKVQTGFLPKMREIIFSKDCHVNNHLLLFTSALVPKALASLLTSFVIATGEQNQVSLQEGAFDNGDILEHLLLEVQRLYPPFLGGRRLVTKECTIGEFKVPAGHAVVYLTFAANRDPTVFENPDEFSPDRWSGCATEKREKLFSFGAGPRGCMGYSLVMNMLKTILKSLLQSYRWELVGDQTLNHKWLPVSRPKCSVQVQFQSK